MRSPQPRRRAPGLALALACLIGATTPGCYALHVGTSQLGIVWGGEPIEEVLERERDPARRAKLELVLEVRRFAQERLGLEESGSYTEVYDTGGRPIAYNVSASAPDALAPHAWWFPIVGTLPYIGYFDLDKARAAVDELEAAGLDALGLPVPAYSTLGWFDDPLFSPMLERSEAELAETVIHELAHATVWVDRDAELNENLAQFIGTKGAEAFFLERGGKDDPALVEARAAARDSERFNAAMDELRAELQRIYAASGERARKLELKEAAFARFRTKFREEVQPALETNAYAGFAEAELNNAWVLVFARYHGERALFEALFEQVGGTVPALVAALEEIAEADDPREALRARVAAGPRRK